MAYLANKIEGQTGSGSVLVTENGARLPTLPARLVRLENWPVLGDLATENTINVLYGFKDQYTHWLNAGGNTDEIIVPGQNLSNIVLRTKAEESVRIFYTWIY